jgi:hypothetical protein
MPWSAARPIGKTLIFRRAKSGTSPEMGDVMIWELLLALSLPLWLVVEQLTMFRRKRRRATIVAARRRSRQAAIDTLLSRT